MTYSTNFVKETGSALIVSLLLLLVLTILGLTGMQSTTMQERMAGNMLDRGMAFQASEAMLREAENWVEGNTNTLENAQTLTFSEAESWNGVNPAPTDSFNNIASNPLSNADFTLAAEPVFHASAPSRIRVGIEVPPTFRKVYTVTTHASGGTNQAIVILQSQYEPFSE